MEFLNYKKRRVFKKFILMGNLNKTTSSTQASYKIKLRKNKQRQLFFQTEKRIIQMIVNNKVISLIDHIEIKDKHYQVMEHYIGGDLDFYIELLLQERNMQSLSGYQGKEFLKQLLNGFKGLQDIFMIHHDLKLKIFCYCFAKKQFIFYSILKFSLYHEQDNNFAKISNSRNNKLAIENYVIKLSLKRMLQKVYQIAIITKQ